MVRKLIGCDEVGMQLFDLLCRAANVPRHHVREISVCCPFKAPIIFTVEFIADRDSVAAALGTTQLAPSV